MSLVIALRDDSTIQDYQDAIAWCVEHVSEQVLFLESHQRFVNNTIAQYEQMGLDVKCMGETAVHAAFHFLNEEAAMRFKLQWG